VEQGRLAGPVAAEQGQGDALGDVEVDVADGRKVAEKLGDSAR
jgi:hypothetical protein